jgi:YfiH family protein
VKYLTTHLEDIPWVRHGFFTRVGGTGEGLYGSLNCGWGSGDDLDRVRANRAKVAEAIGVAPQNLINLKQTHSNTVVTATAPWTREEMPEGDAIVTTVPGIGVGVLTADCAPVLFASKKHKIVAAAHAGWKGAIGGILEQTVAAMKKLGADPAEISASIGPCIGPQSYEVSDSFKAPFLEQDKANARFFRAAEKPGHLIFDLPGYVSHRLKSAGVGTVYDTR